MWFVCRPSWQVSWQDKLIFSFFFLGAISCLGLSMTFHTVQCHSIGVGKLFSKYVLVSVFYIQLAEPSGLKNGCPGYGTDQIINYSSGHESLCPQSVRLIENKQG